MSNEFRRLSGRVAYSSPPYWKIKEKQGVIRICFNIGIVAYPLAYIFVGVAIFCLVASQNEEVREILTLSQMYAIVMLLLSVPIFILIATYLFHWRGKPWLIYDKRKLVLHLPRLALSVPAKSVVAIQSLSGYYGFSGGKHRRWVSELRVIFFDDKKQCVVSVVGTTVPDVIDKAARQLAQVLQTDVIIEEE